jgi:hypothetical protein
MKNKFIIASVFAALSGLAGLANTASAGPDFHINIGIGARPGPVIVAPRCDPPAPVIVVPARGYGYATPVPSYRDNFPSPAPRGFWKEVSVKVWVPAERVRSHDRHGHLVYSTRPGYFTYRTERVWVADAGPGHHGGHSYARGRG